MIIFLGSSHQDNFQWKPGQALPSPSIQPYIYAPDTPDDARNRDTHDGGSSEVLDYLHSLQNSLDSKLQTVCAKLEDIDSRMTSIETRQTSLEEEVRQSVSSSSSASPCFESDKRRKRVTPVLLQVNIVIGI